jgi:putative DNA primase/helicase
MKASPDINDTLRYEGEDAARTRHDAAQRYTPKNPLVIARASTIKPERVDWLWPDRLPCGKCVLVAGEGGMGKSMALAWVAATVSRGSEWPCKEGQSPCGSVIILSAEDDPADTIVPRLMAADADCDKVHLLSAVRREGEQGHRSFNLQADLPALERAITEIGDVLLVIIDPITSYLGKVDSHKNAELRSVLEPLGAMAARQDVTVIANTHLSKAAGGSANSRVIGSVAFVNHARAAFIVTADPEDRGRRLFLPSKANLGRPRAGLAYRIADTTIKVADGELIWAPYVKWEETTVTMSADEAIAAMAGGVEAASAKDEAEKFLLELLLDGPMAQKEIEAAAEGAGLAWRTVRRAKGSLAIEVRREGGIGEKGRWLWQLPKVSSQEIGHLSDLGHLSESKMSNFPKASNLGAGHLSGADGASDGQGTQGDFPELPDFLDRRRVN